MKNKNKSNNNKAEEVITLTPEMEAELSNGKEEGEE